MPLLLNCDLGESFGAWKMGLDDQVMPFIDQANIACGFHAGDPVVIKKTLLAAKRNNVQVGAHPSYPDISGFGRRSMKIPAVELIALLQYLLEHFFSAVHCTFFGSGQQGSAVVVAAISKGFKQHFKAKGSGLFAMSFCIWSSLQHKG